MSGPRQDEASIPFCSSTIIQLKMSAIAKIMRLFTHIKGAHNIPNAVPFVTFKDFDNKLLQMSIINEKRTIIIKKFLEFDNVLWTVPKAIS